MKLVRSHLLGLSLFLGITLIFLLASASTDNGDNGRGASDNSYMESATYVGSDTCGNCHSGNYDSWEATLHTMKVRPISEDIVVADFTIQPNLGYDIVIWHDEGTDTYTVNLSGTNNFTIDWVLGSGTWKQRFMVDIENGTYILPIQWNTHPINPEDEPWVAYHTNNWFDADGDPLQEDWGFGDSHPVPLSQSWQKNCAGCHSTGNVPTENGNHEWISNYAELNVGCEACHGPGSKHVSPPTGEDRKDYIWKSTDSQVCAQCHVRGKSPDGEHGFPTDMYPGDNIWDHYDINAIGSSSYWSGINQSVKHHQQWMDWNLSGHAKTTPSFAQRLPCANCHTPEGADALFEGEELTEVPADVTWNVACVSCHGPHGTDNEHDLRAEKEQLCITCHNAEGAVPGDTPHHPMYEMLTGQGGDGIIGDLRMGGVVTCTDCHMPYTAKSAVKYDIASHTMKVIEPKETLELGIPNSCTSSCHNARGAGNLLTDESAQRVIDTWQTQIDDMVAYVDANLTLALEAIDQAGEDGQDQSLIDAAQEEYDSALFNYELVTHEGSRGVHNFEYARTLLYDSYLKSNEVVDMLDVALPANLPPMAMAGDTVVAEIDSTVTFDGTGSYSPEGTTLTYEWTFGPLSSTSTGAQTTFTWDTVGVYDVTLKVTDEDAQTDMDSLKVYVLDTSGETVDLGPIENDVAALQGLADALGVDIDDLGNEVALLKTKNNDQDTQLTDLKASSQEDENGGVGLGAVIVILIIALGATGAVYMMLKEELDGLRAGREQPTAPSYSAPEPEAPVTEPEEKQDED